MALETVKRPFTVGQSTESKVIPVDSARDEGDVSMLSCSVGIMAYNEEANIRNAIETILEQQSISAEIIELIVVASGCTDGTTTIVSEMADEDPRIHLIDQQRREGKASAINLFIASTRAPILLMIGADVIAKEGTVDALVRHFHDPAVGMVGGHPIPVNDETTFLGHAVHLLWRLHDRLARQSPKLGEMVAFRNVVPSIPPETSVDEISIQALITQLGYRLVYEPRAVVYNRGPTTISDFLRQRRRIYAGHLRVRRQQGYAASTMSVWRIARALLGSGACRTPRAALWTICTIGLEVVARALGHYDSILKRQHHVWATVATTKRQIAEAIRSGPQNFVIFRIADFHRHELELGIGACRRLTQTVRHSIKSALGPNAAVSHQSDGTVLAIVHGDRSEVETIAQEVVKSVSAALAEQDLAPDRPPLQIAYGIVTFSQTGQPVVTSLPELPHQTNLPVLSAG